MNSAEVIQYSYRLCGFLYVRDKGECLIENPFYVNDVP